VLKEETEALEDEGLALARDTARAVVIRTAHLLRPPAARGTWN
jgi:hypothetical protein